MGRKCTVGLDTGYSNLRQAISLSCARNAQGSGLSDHKTLWPYRVLSEQVLCSQAANLFICRQHDSQAVSEVIWSNRRGCRQQARQESLYVTCPTSTQEAVLY